MLTGVMMTGVMLTGAMLIGAMLTGVLLTDVMLSAVKLSVFLLNGGAPFFYPISNLFSPFMSKYKLMYKRQSMVIPHHRL